MELPLQIAYRNMHPSDAVTARINEEAAKLDEFFPRIISCRVVVEAPHRHHKFGELFHVRIDLGVPARELVVSHEPSPRAAASHEEDTTLKRQIEIHPEQKDVYVALRDAFASMRHQLQDYVKRLRGEVKTHELENGDGIDHGLRRFPGWRRLEQPTREITLTQPVNATLAASPRTSAVSESSVVSISGFRMNARREAMSRSRGSTRGGLTRHDAQEGRA